MDIDRFVANVKQRCEELGTSPTVACQESGAGKNLITNIKKGVKPSMERIELLAAFLGCSVYDLTEEAKPEPTEDPVLAEAMAKFRRLTPAQRAAVQMMIDTLAAQNVSESGTK